MRGFRRKIAKTARHITCGRYPAYAVHLAVERLRFRGAIVAVGQLAAGSLPWQEPVTLYVLAEPIEGPLKQ